MDKRAIRTATGARAIIEANIQKIYHLPKKYKNLERAMTGVREDLLDIFNYIKKIDAVIWKQKYTWYLDNKTLTEKIRKKTTYATTNRHFNYLCCIGLINKIPQRGENMLHINMEFMLETGSSIPMNVISVHLYTENELERLDHRAAELLQHGITPGNISKDKLMASGCEALAKEVYYANSENSLKKKEKDLVKVLECIENACDSQGYTTKAEICSSIGMSKDQLDVIFRVFKKQLQQKYTYKAPGKQEKEKYGLENQSWIIQRRA